MNLRLFLSKRTAMSISLLAISSVLIIAFNNCGDPRIDKKKTLPSGEPLIDNQKALIEFCTVDDVKLRTQLKFVFVIDHSSSNINLINRPDPLSPLPPTDRQGTRRYDPLLQFVSGDALSAQPDLFYTIINFNDTAEYVTGYESSVTDQPEVSNTNNSIIDKLGFEKSKVLERDRGGTRYDLALDKVREFIYNDLDRVKLLNTQNEIVTSAYVVFFISDGEPDEGLNASVYRAKVKSIISPPDSKLRYLDRVTFNTVYYYQNHSPVAQNILNSMSDEGKGLFIQAAAGQAINFSEFAAPPRLTKSTFMELWIQNTNTIWWQGKFLADSDADFLPDEIERTLGSDPLNHDSDGDGVRDGVQFSSTGKPCSSTSCATTSAVSLKCANIPHSNSAPFTFEDTDGDFLNDCEELTLRSDVERFDSNNDEVPDSLALPSGLPIVGQSVAIQTDNDMDGKNNYYSLKENFPLNNFGVKSPILFKPMSYKVFQTTPNEASQKCYHYDIENLATLPLANGQPNQIRIHLIENVTLSGRKTTLRTSTKPLRGMRIEFTHKDFKFSSAN
ncbi:MAG: hypothetical protein SGI74_04140 [Oligoflexia bacterium]|nr:hypothetical protein [Oligoflexia bacterium]